MKILTIPKESYLKVLEYNSHFTKAHLIDCVVNDAQWIERDDAEKDPNYLQIIPYLLVLAEGKILVYERLNMGGESRLHGKKSIGVGGHIDELDIPKGDIQTLPITSSTAHSYLGTPWDAVVIGAYRELQEELNIEDTKEEICINFSNYTIFDPSDEVGKVHLGIICTVDLNGRRIGIKEKGKLSGSLINVEDLETAIGIDSDKFETWSKITINNIHTILADIEYEQRT